MQAVVSDAALGIELNQFKETYSIGIKYLKDAQASWVIHRLQCLYTAFTPLKLPFDSVDFHN